MRKYALIVALLALSGMAHADDTNKINRTDRYSTTDADKRYDQTRSQYSTTQGMQPQRVNKASSLVGMTVRNSAGEKLGSIKDLVVDFDSGKISYVVFAADSGVLKPDTLHAVPLDAFQRGADGNTITLNADKTKLAQAPGLDRDSWPNVQNPAWGAQPFWEKRTDIPRYDTDKKYNEDKSHLNHPEQNNTDTDSTQPRPDTQPK
jgi:sporulation protein YlmC with PRC-barrel domain